MPSAVTEINAGAQFSRSSEENQISDSQTRAFKIVLASPSEFVDVQATCGIYIGNPHPINPGIFCVSFDARFEGESRMVLLATFNYRSTPSVQQSGESKDPKSVPPDIRPANWSTSSTLAEVPKAVWRKRLSATTFEGPRPAVNPAGDMYDGVTALEPIVSIKIDQWEPNDPTRFNLYAGSVNLETINLGTLTMTPGTVMFRGVSTQPALESWGTEIYRGWRCTFEFAFRRNRTRVRVIETVEDPETGEESEVEKEDETDIGWDIAVPLSGLNVKAVTPANAAADEEIFAQPLAHYENKVQKGFFNAEGKFTPNANGQYQLPFGVSQGDRVSAMVKVMEYREGGMSLARASAPVALKPNGRALKTHDEDGELINEPYVYAYRVQPGVNFTTVFGLRLF